MGRVCDYTCCNQKNGIKYTYFRFPQDEKRRRHWAELCGLGDVNFKIRDYFICEQHFPARFIVVNQRRKSLLSHAVPMKWDTPDPLNIENPINRSLLEQDLTANSAGQKKTIIFKRTQPPQQMIQATKKQRSTSFNNEDFDVIESHYENTVEVLEEGSTGAPINGNSTKVEFKSPPKQQDPEGFLYYEGLSLVEEDETYPNACAMSCDSDESTNFITKRTNTTSTETDGQTAGVAEKQSPKIAEILEDDDYEDESLDTEDTDMSIFQFQGKKCVQMPLDTYLDEKKKHRDHLKRLRDHNQNSLSEIDRLSNENAQLRKILDNIKANIEEY